MVRTKRKQCVDLRSLPAIGQPKPCQQCSRRDSSKMRDERCCAIGEEDDTRDIHHHVNENPRNGFELYFDWPEHGVNTCIGVRHHVRSHHARNGPGCADNGLLGVDQPVTDCPSEATQNVKPEVARLAVEVFDIVSKNQEIEDVSCDVPKVGVYEKVEHTEDKPGWHPRRRACRCLHHGYVSFQKYKLKEKH